MIGGSLDGTAVFDSVGEDDLSGKKARGSFGVRCADVAVSTSP